MDDTTIMIEGKKFKRVGIYSTYDVADAVAEGIRKTGKQARIKKLNTAWGRATGMYRVFVH
jgi:hypothetical protein